MSQSDVPALPKINDVPGFVRRIEIDRKLDAEHVGQPYRHIRVAGKIKIQLQRIGQRIQPSRKHRKIPGMRKPNFHHVRQRVS